MKKIPLIFAALLFAAAAGAQPQPDLIARIHFAGVDAISADPNHFAFTNEFGSTEARALESQTLDKLSHLPVAWFTSKIAPGTNDGAAQLRPLMDDLLKSEWIFEMRDTTNGTPEYALAIRLNPDRAQVWSKSLQTVLQNWTGVGISQDKTDIWVLKTSAPPLFFQFSRSGDWVVIDGGQDKLSLREEILPLPTRMLVPETNWLTADLNWPRLAQIFPSLKEFDFPKIQLQVVGRGTNLQLTGKLTLAQPLLPLENWRIPTNEIHQPLISFTAVRAAGQWLSRQPWMQPLLIQPQPNQLFIWAMTRIPSQTFAAEPVPDADAALNQLYQHLDKNRDWEKQFMSPLTLALTNHEIAWRGLPPIVTPFVQSVREPAGDFLLGGFFPNTGRSTPLPPELMAHFTTPNLVYYHWEATAERLKELPQFSQLMLVVTRHEQVKMDSTAGKWLQRLVAMPGTSNTEVTQTAPNELTFQRTSPLGLNAVELLALVDWLEMPQFPAPDLRTPPPPARIRPAARPVNVPAQPPGAPATKNP